MSLDVRVVVIVSAGAEWETVVARSLEFPKEMTPFGECFTTKIDDRKVIFVHGGWGKISAAASAQYVIDRWQPEVIINLGTCGGFGNDIQRGDIVLAQETRVYDIYERMGDAQQALEDYRVVLDLSWLTEPYPIQVKKLCLISADQDIDPTKIIDLQKEFGAMAADWESGAIAWVAQRNGVKCLILRGVSDLVTSENGEAYGSWDVFLDGTRLVMGHLLDSVPAWIEHVA